ncbi:MAG TPA: DUF6443 domain-containing protein [Chitinophagaceae bacterium]|nr:DUF6443 domain-containing protein [Chitinophagaceae bacterium]
MIHRKSIRTAGLLGICMVAILPSAMSQNWNPNHAVGTSTGKYSFSYSQTPDQLVEIYAAAIPNTGLSYQWEQSALPLSGFANISGATSGNYSFSGPLSTTTYYRRKSTSGGNSIYSNTIKISVVSSNWEDLNYIREHDVLTTGITSWTSVDQLNIGQKLQTTTYLDGLGRPIQKISRETATPATGVTLWNDIVQFSVYDASGREALRYLPYTTSSQSAKFKTAPLTEQPQYYSSVYNETYPYSSITFDNSPLNRVMNVKEPGTSWAAASGNSVTYDMNGTSDNVQKFSADYTQGNAPVNGGAYAANILYKLSYTDVNGKQVVEYTNKSGQLILKKVQLDNSPSAAHSGWICTYNVYDDFGLLRFQLQPEAVKYLDNNSWSFAGTNGQLVLAEQCFQYFYDEKGRTTWKKAPGASPLSMIYDVRDRVVFMQDGNQAAFSTPQWTANLYDELDRSSISVLYNTSSSISTLQSDINNASATGSVTINNSGTVSVTATLSLNPISSSNLNNTSVCTVLSYNFYDNYSFNAVKTFDNNFTNTSAYNNNDPDVRVITKTNRTTGIPTGSMVRVLGTTTFLSFTHYYDEKINLIQTLEDNIKGGVDITTLQYHFSGRMLSSCTDHTTPNTGYTNFKILTKNVFDKLGRTTSIQKQFGTNSFKTISSYDYDDIGRIKTKHLDPGYNNPNSGGPDLESLDYSYNIHNQITGINKDYALKTAGNYSKWGHFFGLYLGFDNRDNVFSNANLTGQVTGLLWNTQGDDNQRRYNYTYDNAGRLINGAFTEQPHPGDGWSNSKMDFSVSGSSGQITYDLNGNLLTMLQKGVVPGSGTPLTIDDLQYTYASYSNKLQTVADQMSNTSLNGLFGDFKDGANGANPDYVYDADGNLVIDLNKNAKDLGNVTGANGIKYNFLDKPEQIRIAGKGTIQIVYSASGEKLQRIFTPEPSGAAVTTSYINQYVYQETAGGSGATLQFINFEEGRVRVMTAASQNNGYDALSEDGNMTLPNSKKGVYDYFIMDYQQNVRMILTEETHSASNTCTMENSRSSTEEPIFGQTGSSNEVVVTRYATPSAWQNGNIGSSVSRLGNTATHNIGPNTLQRVMAGDSVSASVLYYHTGSASGNNTGFVSALLGSLGQAITGSSGASGLVKGSVTNITNQLNANTGFTNAVQPGGASGTPLAYLTILFFDERFNFISAADGGVSQQQVAATVGSSGSTLGLSNIKAPKNGYVFVYVSNQSNQDVYFDNLLAGIVTGNIIEENHYYAYGLKIATISSRKLADANEGNISNNYLYNAKELFDDADLGWYDYGFRSYDPQIGRFAQLDPLTDNYPFLAPYQYASCDPITNIDINGLEDGSTVLGVISGAVVTAASDMQGVVLASGGVGAVLSATKKTSAVINGVIKAVKVAGKINTPIKTRQIGNVSESTCQNCNGMRYDRIIPPPVEAPSIKQWNPSESEIQQMESAASIREQNGGYDDSYMLSKIKGWALEEKPGDRVPIVGPLVRAGRLEIRGYHKEALNSLGKAGLDAALMLGPGYVFKGVKYLGTAGTAAKTGTTVIEEGAVHGNSLKSLRTTWGYKLYSSDGTFLKNGITSKLIPESRYTKAFMLDKKMIPFKQFSNRLEAYQWEFQQNQILRGPLNFNMH